MINVKLRTETFISYNEYLKDIKKKTYLNIDNGFIEEINNGHVCDIFRDIIIDNLIFVTFSDEEKRRFNYRPKVLSKSLYGTSDLFFIILKLNNLTHPSEFDIGDGIYLMHQSNVTKLVGAIQELKNNL